MTFEDFVHEHGTSLLRFACVLARDHHAGEDLTQTAFAHAYRHWRKVSAASNPQAYLRKVALNAHIDHTRRRSSTETPQAGFDLASVPAAGGPRSAAVSTSPSADSDLLAREHLQALVAALPRRAREVLVLRYYADFDDEEIAAAMGTTTSTVRATASRALAALRQASRPGDLPTSERQ